MKIVHCTPGLPARDDRIGRAQETWQELYRKHQWAHALKPCLFRDSRQFGDARALPFWRDIISQTITTHARSQGCSVFDIVAIWTCDDVIFIPKLVDEQVRELANRSFLFTGQRVDVKDFGDIGDPSKHITNHCGRVLFGITWDSLPLLPDFVIGAPYDDICIAAVARKMAGVKWTLATSSVPAPECELTHGAIFHECHSVEWCNDPKLCASTRHNAALCANWFRQNMPDGLPEFMKDC